MDNQTLPSEQVSLTPPSVSAKSRDWFKISLIFVGFLIAIGLFGNIYLQITSTPTQTSLPRVCQPADLRGTPAPDPTANWKTYISKVLNVTLKYPPELKFDQKEIFPGTHEYIRFESINGYMTIETLGCNIVYPDPVLKDKVIVGGIVVNRYRIAPSGGYEKLVANPKLKNGKCIDITMGFKPQPEEETIKTFDLILSTFKFLP